MPREGLGQVTRGVTIAARPSNVLVFHLNKMQTGNAVTMSSGPSRRLILKELFRSKGKEPTVFITLLQNKRNWGESFVSNSNGWRPCHSLRLSDYTLLLAVAKGRDA